MPTVKDRAVALRRSDRESANAAIKDRHAIADHVADWMHNHCPSWSVDTLLCHPSDAQAMARWVCRKLHRKVDTFAEFEVCRAALASRKRGELKRDRV